MKKILILSHRDADGITSAVSYIWNYLEINNLSKNIKNIYKYSDIISLDYGDDLKKKLDLYKITPEKYSQVILLDFSLPKEIMSHFYEKFKENFIWIDHHKGPNKEYETYFKSKKIKIKGIRDHNHAACFLVWKYFKKGAPEFVKYIQDIDIWKFSLKDSKYFIAGLPNFKEDFTRTKINYVLKMFDIDCFNKEKKKIIERGKIISKNQEEHVLGLIHYGKIINFHKKKAFIINTNFDSGIFSDTFFKTKNIKYKDAEILIVWKKDYSNNLFYFSLRKKENSKIDLSKIAKEYGGGGHPAASGFTLNSLTQLKYN
jgi:uncharacterized protein